MSHRRAGHRNPGLIARCLFIVTAISLLVSGCSPPTTTAVTPAAPATQTPTPRPTDTPDSTPLPGETPIPATLTPQPDTVWVAPYLPAAFQESIQLADGISQVDTAEQATYLIDVGQEQPISQWVYALVAPFATIPDGVTGEELFSAWRGEAGGPFTGLPLLMDQDTHDVLSKAWGEPDRQAVRILPAGRLENYAWDNRPAWGIVPFEFLNPRWKVLAIDESSPVRVNFDPVSYPLTMIFSQSPNQDVAKTGAPPVQQALATNREADKLTTVILTGVTALVRATAETMRRNGAIYPGLQIGDTLRAADITHVSNEVPFTPECPFPNPKQPDLVFCSNPDYLELLTYIGTDVVELSGDHFGDWGAEAMEYTLNLYEQAGIPYYGGGYSEDEARQPLLIEHNGNKLAFLGCNAKGGGYATARGDNPGAVACDYEWMAEEIKRLRGEGYLPIVTLQHFEYFSYIPQPKLITDFRALAEAGALIVSGSQAHQPHGMEFYADGFLHYGLGNLFFDQYHMGLPTGQGMLDRHVFYDGRHISSELIGIRFIDYAQSRLMTVEEKEELLQSVFEASGW
jgi:poly-gamma-glutamate synthesis protein (capsule biosynthesis protein)